MTGSRGNFGSTGSRQSADESRAYDFRGWVMNGFSFLNKMLHVNTVCHCMFTYEMSAVIAVGYNKAKP